MSLLDEIRKQNQNERSSTLDQVRSSSNNTSTLDRIRGQQERRQQASQNLSERADHIRSQRDKGKYSDENIFIDSQEWLYDHTLGPVQDWMNRATVQAVDEVSGGSFTEKSKEMDTPEQFTDKYFEPAENTSEKVADITGTVGAYALPYGGAYRLTANAATKAASALRGGQTLGRATKYVDDAVRGAFAGATVGAGMETSQEIFNPDAQTFGEHARDFAIETAGGAVLDPAFRLAGAGLKKAWNSPQIQNQMGLVNFKGNRANNDPSRLPYNVMQNPVDVDLPNGRLADKTPNFQQQGGDFSSFRNKVDRDPQKRNKFSSMYQQLRTQFIEDLAPLETLEKNVRGKIPEAQNSLYKQARLFRGSPEKSHNFVRNRIKPIIDDVESQGYSYEDLGDYALAVHARDVNEKGINSGFTNEEIESVIQRLGTPQMEQARKQLVNVSTDLLQTLENAQVLEPGTTQALRQRHPNYMPLFRSFDDDKIEFGQGLSRSLANASSPIKKLEGSDRNVVDPIESMVKNVFKTFNVADRNQVAQQIGKLADEDTAGDFVRRVEGDTKRKNVVSVMENGQKVKYEVPAEVYETISNLNQESSNLLIKLMQKPASVLRAGATLDPAFSLRNPMRDILQAFVVSGSGFNPVRDFPAGLLNAIFKGRKVNVGGKEITLGKHYQDFIEANGGFGNIVSMDRNLHRDAIKQGLNDQSNAFVNVVNPRSWVQLLRAIADASETATKVGEFRAAKRKGVSNEEAAYRARDIMDFSRAGVSVREANKVVAFLNANIQGKSKLIRATLENPAKVASKAAVGVALPTIGFYTASQLLANEQQKAMIDDAPQWMKQSFWLTPIPGTDKVARIPKPFDLTPISNAIERALDYTIENDKRAFEDFGKEIVAGQSLPVMLTGLAPFMEGLANYSFFRQGPIIPRREQNLEFNDQYDINTSGSARFIADHVNKLTGGEGSLRNFGSPRIVDNTIRGLTAGLGEYATNALDSIFFDDFYDRPEKPAQDVLTEQTPLEGFLVNEMGTGQSMSNLYDLREQLTREKGSARQERKLFKDQAKLSRVNSATGRISDITARMRRIENDENMSSDEKRKRLEELNEQRNEVARRAWSNLQGG